MPKLTGPLIDDAPVTPADAPVDAPLLRIQEVAAETGLTSRTIRYYEEMGLLEPAARSDGDYRLFDASDLERLKFIRSLRDDAGFSLAQIGQLLEDEGARERNRERFRSTKDPVERRALAVDSRLRVERQIATLEAKAARLATMIDTARARRAHLDAHLAELDGGPDPHPGRGAHPTTQSTAEAGGAAADRGKAVRR
jgi:DNA-binding transcriptional MerR regulator